MGLKSSLLAGNARLEDCALLDSAHVTTGDKGAYVAKIQAALEAIDGLVVDAREWNAKQYGASTAAAVLSYKTKRKIINRAYQNTPDAIVGKMTIAALDAGMLEVENAPDGPSTGRGHRCSHCQSMPKGAVALVRPAQMEQRMAALVTRQRNAIVSAVTSGPVAAGPKPKLSVGIGDSWAIQDDLQHIVIARGGTERIVADTAGQACFLVVPENVTVDEASLKFATKKFEGPGFSRFDFGARAGKFELALTGAKPLTMPIALRGMNEPLFFDRKRDVTLAVKQRLERTVKFVLPTDAKDKTAEVSSAEIDTQFAFVRNFFLRKCNVSLQFGRVITPKVDEDLDDFNHTRAVARLNLPDDAITNQAVGRRSRLFENEFDKSASQTTIVVYVLRKVKSSNANLVAVTLGRRVFMQDTGKDLAKWTKALAHELGHALGVPGTPHPDPPGFLMTELIEGMGNVMSLVSTEMVNPARLVP